MAQALTQRFITEEEYRAQEVRSDIKHEYFNGEIFTMAGGTPRHARLSLRAGSVLDRQLRGNSCRAAGSDQQVKIEATGLVTYPDVVVYCQPFRFDERYPNTLLNPTVLIEVLSESTAAYDQGEKFDHYKQLPSLSDYLLVWQDRVRVDYYRRLGNDDWLLHTAATLEESISIQSINCLLPLGELYEDIELPDTPHSLRATPPQSSIESSRSED